ncbi:hypothetical protein SAMN05421766_102376 [Zobellia uliginosa]|uniref:CBU-0592-like domain-containing protein n=1 Tax=Zobellia uliginosa TaxID=143224 RepID=A0ABY1KM97_9FLAO|nr:hypothetical protein [Zobellia uliginosa]MDO6518808.1 hypothetical protein [Zobellia uliginosa]SIS49324.1 hypothetical protein SAMN05421766_102376 [Zobellia uliginosa]
MKLLIDVFGWMGSGLIILAYAITLMESKKYLGYSKYLNLLGGLLIAGNCYYYSAIPPFVSNMLWSIIAILTIYKTRKKNPKANNRKRLT